MAVGTQYSVAENGWIRFEENNSNFEYSTGWINWSGVDTSGGTDNRTNTVGQTIKFGFIGNSIRIIAPINKDLSNSIKISIDGKEEIFTEYNATLNWRVCVYEKTGLPNKKHTVVITTNSTATNILDAVDLVVGSSIIPYQDSLPIRKMVIQNPNDSNQHYSLSDNTLIHLPDNTTESIIEHGIEKDRYIQLDVPFDKHRHFNNTPVDGTSGKVFTQDVGVINTLSIKELLENKGFKPLYTWYETKMTANNAPSPLVAFSSSEQSATFASWKAFDGNVMPIDNQSSWSASITNRNGTLALNFGSKKVFDCIRLTALEYTTSPKDFQIQATNDNTGTWTTLLNVTNEVWSQSISNETKVYTFDNTTEYQYYMIVITQVSASNKQPMVTELVFGNVNREVN
ncbi:discoidin domain-containing protein [Lysinibacillus fusiformis]|uniref:discoidin domain-containing protein n=1 Tax=Lysinibacillus fusiformis TaxID=28031 RepID=UPI00381AE68B